MTPRNPDESSTEDVHDQVLQAINDALNSDVQVLKETSRDIVQDVKAEREPAFTTEAETDRVETYFQGPTAFTA